MNLLEAAIMGAAYTIVFLYFIGEKIIKVDFSGLLKRNWKSTKRKKMLAPVEGDRGREQICRARFGVLSTWYCSLWEKRTKGFSPPGWT